jgi:hypothetical protein
MNLWIYSWAQGATSNLSVWTWFAAVAWALWLTRNECVFQHKVFRNPLNPLYSVVSILLQLKQLAPPKRAQEAEKVVEKFNAKLKEIYSASVARTGVG